MLLVFLVSWASIASLFGPHSHRARAGLRCHAHVFTANTLVARSESSLCVEGAWECRVTEEVVRGTARYQLTVSEQPSTHIQSTFWHLTDEGCEGDLPEALSSIVAPPFPYHSTFTGVGGHVGWQQLIVAALQDFAAPVEVIGGRMLGADMETYSYDCP